MVHSVVDKEQYSRYRMKDSDSVASVQTGWLCNCTHGSTGLVVNTVEALHGLAQWAYIKRRTEGDTCLKYEFC